MEQRYDLEARSEAFVKAVVAFCKKVPDSLSNLEFKRQLFKSSGSVGANYIEANEGLGKKDFLMRIRISRKEAKEARYWLKVLEIPDGLRSGRDQLCDEATAFIKIFSAIIRKVEDHHHASP